MTSTTTDRRFGVNAGMAVKVPCRVATTANITLSGEQTIDGVACVTGDRVLVKNQTTGANNGIYIVDTGDWTRAPDFDGAFDFVKGTFVHVTDGSAFSGSWWEVTTTDPVIGSTLTLTATFLGDASTVSFTQAGTGAVTTTLQARGRLVTFASDFLPAGYVTDGSVDYTTQIQAAITALPTGGGEIIFPRGRYKGNWTITKFGVKFKSEGFARDSGKNTQLVPAVLASPVISVGDGTTLCTGFQIDGIVLEGSGTGAIGLKINGAEVCVYRNFSSQGFTDANVRITSSAAQHTDFQFFDGFDIEAHGSAASIGLDVSYGSTFATALYFSNGTIGSQTGSLWAIQVDKSVVNLANVWIQVGGGTGKGINLKSTGGTMGSLSCANVMVDSNAATDVLLNLDQNVQIGTAVFGTVTIDGKCTMPAGTTGALTSKNISPFNNTLGFPYCIGSVYLVDSTTPYLSYAFPTDCSLARTADNVVLTSAGYIALRTAIGQAVDVWTSGNAGLRLNNIATGQRTDFLQATTSVNTSAGATVSATNLIPAGSLVIGVTTRVTSLITGATSYSVGDGTGATRYGNTIAVAAGTTTSLADTTLTSPLYYTAATSVVLTANGSNFTGGAVRVTVHYIKLSPETS